MMKQHLLRHNGHSVRKRCQTLNSREETTATINILRQQKFCKGKQDPGNKPDRHPESDFTLTYLFSTLGLRGVQGAGHSSYLVVNRNAVGPTDADVDEDQPLASIQPGALNTRVLTPLRPEQIPADTNILFFRDNSCIST